jgi:homoserine kinase type II
LAALEGAYLDEKSAAMNVNPSLEQAAREVCRAYDVTQAGMQLYALGNHGGFSGARLWRVQTLCGTFCLRAWPPDVSPTARLPYVQGLMQQASDSLPFVARVLKTASGTSHVVRVRRAWEMTTWLPGVADFHDHPTVARLQAAMEALARLHCVWQRQPEQMGHCHAVRRRLIRLREYQQLQRLSSGELDRAINRRGHADLAVWSRRALDQVRAWSEAAFSTLRRGFPNHLFSLQPCLCDIWHHHVLFEGQRVTGIVDFGGARDDNVGADLARLLGSLIGDDAQMRATGLAAYEAYRPLSAAERQLAGTLDWTGVVVGTINWLRWLYLEARRFEDTQGVVRRLAELVTRMEGWKTKAHGLQPVGW